MHKIDRLEIFGFKSFCEKTDIMLNGEVTAIVGPNGCGKSNIADAISWVLGEQSHKSLRAGKMEEVIFSGTQRRKALGLAEVTLTLRDFHNGTHLPPEFSSDDGLVTVSRRLYRSGESEYFLNGRHCRLKDVHGFFEGTGLGSTSYALIEQGRIEIILGSKPQDRRVLIEEAARVSIFKSRRKAAELKLELSRQNLARVTDIVHEVEQQMASLKRQAAKARRYYRLREELKFFSRITLCHRSRALTEETRRIREQLDALAEEEHRATQQFGAESETRRHLLEEIGRMEYDMAQRREEFATLRVEGERANQQYTHQETRRQSLLERTADIDETMADYTARLDRAEGQSNALRAEREALGAEIAAGEAEVQTIQARVQQLTIEIESTESELNSLRTSTLGEVEQLAERRNQQTRLGERLAVVAKQRAQLDEERARLQSEQDRLAERRRTIEAALDTNAATTQALRATLASETATAARLKAEAERQEAELAERTRAIQSLQHRLASLEEIEARRTNYAEGVKRFLNAGPSPGDLRILGTLADFIETDPRLEAAVESFMDAHLQHVVVESLDDAMHCLDQVHSRQTGRCSFLVLETGPDAPPPDAAGVAYPALSVPHDLAPSVLGPLTDLLTIDPQVRPAVARAFPDLAGVVAVSDLPAARALARENAQHTFLTLRGDTVSRRGLVSAHGEQKEGIGFLSLKRERKERATQIEQCQTDLQASARQLDQVKEAQRAHATYSQDLAEQLHRQEIERSSLRPQLDQSASELDRLAAQANRLDQEHRRLDQERAILAAEQDAVASALLAMESEGRTRAERLLALEETLPPRKRERDRLLHALGDQRLQVAAKTERQRALQIEVERLAAQVTDHSAMAEKLRRERAQVQATLESLQQSNEALQLEIQAFTGRHAELEEALQSEQARVAAHKEQVQQVEDRLAARQEQRQALMESRTQSEVERARRENDLQHLQAACQEEFHEDLESLARGMTEEHWQYDPPTAEQNYQDVKQKLEAIGAINMGALEEYQQLEERYNFLLSQQTDIQNSIQATQDALAEINRRSAEQFKETFEAINRNFKELFTVLFGGGHCEMRLLDEGDILESGIEIVAQPPGKRLQNVMLLSGGEKALVALALLLGIFKFRPSPFCLLDEVDAPLDDANVLRFTRLLAEMGKDTQFILITHNKRTMEVAQYLYGVTMEEAGVSKIVSVKFA